MTGSGFGAQMTGSYVKFGASVASVCQWTDPRIVVTAPSDLGTGTNTLILVSAEYGRQR